MQSASLHPPPAHRQFPRCVFFSCASRRRYDFLHRLVEQYGGDGSAALLPNFVFSQALARWYQEQGGWGDALATCAQRPTSRPFQTLQRSPSAARLLVLLSLLPPACVLALEHALHV